MALPRTAHSRRVYCSHLRQLTHMVIRLLRNLSPSTVETAYKVYVCPRENLLYKRIYLISNRPKVTLKGLIGALIYLLYK